MKEFWLMLADVFGEPYDEARCAGMTRSKAMSFATEVGFTVLGDMRARNAKMPAPHGPFGIAAMSALLWIAVYLQDIWQRIVRAHETRHLLFAVMSLLAWSYLTRHAVDSREIATYQPAACVGMIGCAQR